MSRIWNWLNPKSKQAKKSSINKSRTIPTHLEALQSSPAQYQSISQQEKRKSRLQEVLSSPLINIASLRSLTWHGIDTPSLRGEVWKILLNYLPLEKSRQSSHISRKRAEYQQYIQTLYSDIDHALHHQIVKDVKRTRQEIPIFCDPPFQARLIRLLYILAIRNPASGYVQGINELSVPFILSFLDAYPQHTSEVFDEVEADTYWCLSIQMTSMHEFFINDIPGVQKSVDKIRKLIPVVEPELAEHMTQEDLDPSSFAYRWVSCFMIREFPLDIGLRVWDALLADEDSFPVLSIFLCLATLKRCKADLINMAFGEMVLYLQNLASLDWKKQDIELIIAESFFFKTLYHTPPQPQRRITKSRTFATS